MVTDDFIGRGPELDKIRTLLLDSARLITLTGAGGIGKTRLATEAIRGFGRAGSTPVYWVRLTRLAKDSDSATLEDEVARSVFDADISPHSTWDAIIDSLTGTDAMGRSRQTVLVMDNCEHVLAAAGRLIAELLDAVPGLTVLATSREAIGWVDEHLVVVPPLTQSQAVALFLQRAELTGHPVVDGDEVTTTSLICRHVHNHPLYIRLAAARLLHQPLAMILQELVTDKRMAWSHGPRVGAEPRHQGVRDVIAWSYDLCQDKERLLLDRMSVFAAGYDTNLHGDADSALDVGAALEAIKTICVDDATPAPEPGAVTLASGEVERLLERLADQSLVTVHITPTTVQYSLLESIRLFAKERLAERSTDEVDEPSVLAQRHLRYYRDKVVAAQRDWFNSDEQNWARAAWDNIVTAIETSIASGEPAAGLEIAAGLIALPFFKGSPRDIRRWTERTLQAARVPPPQPDELQLAAMTLIGWIWMMQGRNDEVERILDECATICIDDPQVRDEWRQAPEHDVGLPASVEFLWGCHLGFGQRDAKSTTVLSRACEKYRNLGDAGGEVRSELYSAWTASLLGSAAQALETTRRHLDHATASGAGWARAWAELAWANALTRHGDPAEALAVGRVTLARQVATRDQWGAGLTVSVRTWSLAHIMTDMIATGSADRNTLRTLATETARLAGGAATLRVGLGINLNDLALISHENNKATEVARQVLGREMFTAAYRQGSLLRPELHEAQQLALGTLSIDAMPLDHPARRNTPSHWDELSAAEQGVATLAAAGWTNAAIAARRGKSRRTVDSQMASIFNKLTIASREDIIKLIPQEQIAQVRQEAAKRPPRTRTTA